ncbi:MAG: hypothetical protein ACI815_000501 [Psychroserpens sp.]|jgi:hypothetical protein
MKSIFQKVFSITMALFLMASTVSWTIGMHYCGKSLVDIVFFGHAEKCGMDQSTVANSESDEWRNLSCCVEEIAVIVGQDNLTSSHDDSSRVLQLFFTVSNTPYALFEGADVNITSYNTYLPPTLVRNVQLLDQVFLI